MASNEAVAKVQAVAETDPNHIANVRGEVSYTGVGTAKIIIHAYILDPNDATKYAYNFYSSGAPRGLWLGPE